MNPKDRKNLVARLLLMDANERRKLYKKAAEMRRSQPKPTRRTRFADDDEDGYTFVKIRSQAGALDELVLKLLQQQDEAPAESEIASLPPTHMVLAANRNLAEVESSEGRSTARILAPILAAGGVVAGDRVRVEGGVLTMVAPRRTRLSRPDPARPAQERVVVANVDTVVIVVSVGSPPLHPRIIDRFLIAVQRGGARPVLCVNKIDQATSEADLAPLAPYRSAGVPILYCSTWESVGIEALRQELKGQLAAFVGHSGVGKSSLLNALRPDLGLEVGDLMRNWRRGAHTTTQAHLWDVGDGTLVIDIPGIREFGLWSVSAEELARYFPEFATAICRFRDCRHEREPGCGVRAAVERGDVPRERLETYLRLAEQLE